MDEVLPSKRINYLHVMSRIFLVLFAILQCIESSSKFESVDFILKFGHSHEILGASGGELHVTVDETVHLP